MPGLLQRDRGRGYDRPIADINVTPLVDVMLVLLVVFMVAAPLMASSVTVDLPKASAAPLAQESEPLSVSVTADGKIFLNDTELGLGDLAPRLAAISEGKVDRRILVRGDKGVPYGRIMEAVAAISQGGFTKVDLVTEQASKPAAASPVPGPAPTR